MKTSLSALPQGFLDRLKKIVPSDRYESILASFSSPKPTSFRVNPLKTSSKDLLEKLKEMKIEVKPVDWYHDAFVLKSEANRMTISNFQKEGSLYIQNLASMIPPLILNPASGDLVLDIAAAPGSKTSQLAALMNNQGLIVANDISRPRLFILKRILASQGVKNTTLENLPGQELWWKYPNHFDRVLIDAPCSLEGSFSALRPKSFAGWSAKKVRLLAKRQKTLLRSALAVLKPGGVAVYSTCTISVEENEEVIDWILRKEAGRIELEKVDCQLPERIGPVLAWEGKKYDSRLRGTMRIAPSLRMEGFFVARLRKLSF
jgi:NOL1/NOP2/sun family putative RNA methylase